MTEKRLECPRPSCTFCFACGNICPHDAIETAVDDLGCEYPAIITEKCVNCGLCDKVCPEINSVVIEARKPHENCYAIWSNSEDDRKTCASGGIATAMSRHFIQTGGVVFGAAFDNEINLCHHISRSEAELEAFKGSKYVKSHIGFAYREAKSELKTGKNVLFIGTPCQIAGLYGFLGQAYKNLLTIDLICHGTPSRTYFSDYVKAKFPNERVTSASFRGKHNFNMTFYSENDIIYEMPFNEDLYFYLFLEGALYYPTCYNCKYANTNRIADITIGDFWGIDRKTLSPKYDGRISVLLTNTDSGSLAFDSMSRLFTFQRRSLKEAIRGNDQLREPYKIRISRKTFIKNYKKHGFMYAAERARRILNTQKPVLKLTKSIKKGIAGIIGNN